MSGKNDKTRMECSAGFYLFRNFWVQNFSHHGHWLPGPQKPLASSAMSVDGDLSGTQQPIVLVTAVSFFNFLQYCTVFAAATSGRRQVSPCSGTSCVSVEAIFSAVKVTRFSNPFFSGFAGMSSHLHGTQETPITYWVKWDLSVFPPLLWRQVLGLPLFPYRPSA